MVHEIKLRESFAEAVMSGDKNFEVRLNDRGYQKGDYVVFKVTTDNGLATIDSVLSRWFFEITYVLSGWGIKEDYCVFGIKRATYMEEVKG